MKYNEGYNVVSHFPIKLFLLLMYLDACIECFWWKSTIYTSTKCTWAVQSVPKNFGKMLSPEAWYYYYHMLEFGCMFRVFPYKFDVVTRRLLPASTTSVRIFRLHKTVVFTVFCFVTFRFLQNVRKSAEEFPLFTKVLYLFKSILKYAIRY